jgi:hypothetical protein
LRKSKNSHDKKIYLYRKDKPILEHQPRPTVYRLIKEDMPNYKVRGRRLFDPDEVAAWVKSHGSGGSKKKKGGAKSGKKKRS